MHMIWFWISILLLGAYQASLTEYLLINPEYYQLDAYTWESEDFRRISLGEMMSTLPSLDYDLLAACMVEKQYNLEDITRKELEHARQWKTSILQVKPVEFKKLSNGYAAVFSDISCFPVPVSTRKETPFVTYADSYGSPRSYGGERSHEGCDIMGNARPRGFYPVLSMTGGVIEQVGWLEKGGWRIGVRAPAGAYFYYAHLYRYATEWKVGDVVFPGTLLGYMGDSGYGIQEGTIGNFDVHLHLGIYLRTDHYEEMSVDPYWVLRYSERFMRQADY